MINESREFLERISAFHNKVYYFERIGRLLINALLVKNLLVPALDFYIICMMYTESIVTRMPLDELSKRILNSKPTYSRLKRSIELAILLYKYYSNHNQLEKYVPVYMDFMEQYKNINNYLDTITNYDGKSVYFLYHACTEDVLIYDYISCNRNDATHLRMSILSKLALVDEKNAMTYLGELRSLSREELIHKRSRLFTKTSHTEKVC